MLPKLTPVLAPAIAALIDESGLLTHAEWADVLGVSVLEVDAWSAGVASIIDVLESNANANRAPLEQLRKMARLALYDVVLDPALHDCPTHWLGPNITPVLADWLLTPSIRTIGSLLRVIPWERRQEAFEAACTALRQVRDRD